MFRREVLLFASSSEEKYSLRVEFGLSSHREEKCILFFRDEFRSSSDRVRKRSTSLLPGRVRIGFELSSNQVQIELLLFASSLHRTRFGHASRREVLLFLWSSHREEKCLPSQSKFDRAQITSHSSSNQEEIASNFSRN